MIVAIDGLTAAGKGTLRPLVRPLPGDSVLRHTKPPAGIRRSIVSARTRSCCAGSSCCIQADIARRSSSACKGSVSVWATAGVRPEVPTVAICRPDDNYIRINRLH
jgi:hypothetical protein